ncbi:MAG TPA: precorrin-3B C(17)-methyltransferase [Acidimicrobiales bacterium]|nr:precorrin-3B C(17)-methyltransferase [Acidimicrobiales bacterium]
MNVLTISVSEPGRTLARRLPYRHVHGAPAQVLAEEWDQVDAVVMVLAVGATVRLIAPRLADKASDPAVVCLDDAARYAVVVAGGHAGGANALAAEIAALTGAEPVVTTATDRLGVPALDQLPGLAAEGDVAAVTAAVLAGEPLDVDNELDWPLPESLAAPGPEGGRRARVVVSDRTAGPSGDDRPTVRLRPASLVVGVGTSSDAGSDELAGLVTDALADAGLAVASVTTVATVDRRADHPAVRNLAHRLGAAVVAFDPPALSRCPVPHPSAIVEAAVGTPSVAEAAALLAAGPASRLVVDKRVGRRATVAVARRAGPPGALFVVGLGPGDAALRTPAAAAAVRHAEVVVGYSAYVDQAADLLGPAQEVLRFPLGAEVERARVALERAAGGRRVALVCSGDAGVYAMASPLLELAGTLEGAGPEITVVPGVTAAQATAAVLGAPLGHDHALISLSDLHTPWSAIEARLRAAAAADLVVVLFNPRSARRTWQLEKALAVLAEHRRPGTPVGVVTDAGRPGQRAEVTTLAEVDAGRVTMTTCVVVGSTTTAVLGGRMVTPRGYDR